MASLDSQWTVLCLLLCLTAVASVTDVRDMSIDEYISYVNPPAVHKFLNKYGDTILCVAYEDQISLRGSKKQSAKSMNDRKIKAEVNISSYGVKTNCPEGTVTIMETKRERVERAGSVANFLSKRGNITRSSKDNGGHEYGIIQFITTERINGAVAGLNLWQPYVNTDDGGEFSLAQIWVINTGTPLETVEAGWIVYPKYFGDALPRIFTYWTADGYQSTGCYNTQCDGFVKAPGAPDYLGQPVGPVSTYDGQQQQVITKIIKETPDDDGARWSLYIANQLIGWWPVSLFNNLQRMADRADFGGEVGFLQAPAGSKFTSTDMGSGHFSYEGNAHSAAVWNIQMTESDGTAINIPGQKAAGRLNCYDVNVVTGPGGDNTVTHIFYGGPGGDNPGCVV